MKFKTCSNFSLKKRSRFGSRFLAYFCPESDFLVIRKHCFCCKVAFKILFITLRSGVQLPFSLLKTLDIQGVFIFKGFENGPFCILVAYLVAYFYKIHVFLIIKKDSQMSLSYLYFLTIFFGIIDKSNGFFNHFFSMWTKVMVCFLDKNLLWCYTSIYNKMKNYMSTFFKFPVLSII